MISLNNKNEDAAEDSVSENNILYYSLKNIKYYNSLYNLIFLYIGELKNIKLDTIDYDESFNQELIKKIIKKIEKYNKILNDKIVKFDISYKIKENIILNLLKLYKLFIRLYNNLNTHIQIINERDIYD